MNAREMLRTRAALSAAEVGALLGVSENAIRMKLHRGQLASVRVGGRRMIPTAVLEDLLTPADRGSNHRPAHVLHGDADRR